MKNVRFFISIILLVGSTIPTSVHACACGCNVFGVGTISMFSNHPGSMAFVEYDYQNQNRNWSGKSPSSANNNGDLQITTDFITLGYKHMFNRRWKIIGELPYWNRYWKGLDSNGTVNEVQHSAIGDIRIRGIYTGLSPDMSYGLIFGLKLPSGDYSYRNLDPDTNIGTGSTDLILGGYHFGMLPANWGWFVNAQGQLTTLYANGYRPGSQFDATAGTYYNGLSMGSAKIVPTGQVIGSYRESDDGPLGHPMDTGFNRIILAPGIEFDLAGFLVFADVGFPIYQYINGNQLVASQLIKFNIAYKF